jgi:hypothetical protein
MRAGHVEKMGETWNIWRSSVGKPLGRLRSGWEDNIRLDFREVGCRQN